MITTLNSSAIVESRSMQAYQQSKTVTRNWNTRSFFSRLLFVALPLSPSASSLSHPEKIPGFAKMSSAAKLDSPSAQRNKEPIWDFLSSNPLASPTGANGIRVLEIAAGAGVHTEHFANRIASTPAGKSSCTWYPSDPSEESRASIQCYIDENKLGEIVKSPLPLTLDKNGIIENETKDALSGLDLDLIICINMIHISPWEATLGLMKLASEKLCNKGYLYCYGPYKVDGNAVESNLRFDASLKSRNPSWGVRNLEDVCAAADDQGLELIRKTEMPANNLSLLFQKSPS
eukprot:scaffold4966_cov204-Cylindrotheca_fusiformis.AAC.2